MRLPKAGPSLARAMKELMTAAEDLAAPTAVETGNPEIRLPDTNGSEQRGVETGKNAYRAGQTGLAQASSFGRWSNYRGPRIV